MCYSIIPFYPIYNFYRLVFFVLKSQNLKGNYLTHHQFYALDFKGFVYTIWNRPCSDPSFCCILPTLCLTHFILILLQKDDRDKPLFVLEPKKPTSSLSPPASSDSIDEMQQLLRTPSYKEAVRSSENFFFANIPMENARAGFQQNVRFFIAISAQIFYVKQTHETMSKHVSFSSSVNFIPV